jgi:hypothetical protein
MQKRALWRIAKSLVWRGFEANHQTQCCQFYRPENHLQTGLDAAQITRFSGLSQQCGAHPDVRAAALMRRRKCLFLPISKHAEAVETRLKVLSRCRRSGFRTIIDSR